MSKKNNVNLYNKNLTSRVAEFVTCRTTRKRLSLVYADKIAEIKAKIDSHKKLYGSVFDRSEIDAAIIDLEGQIEKLKEERAEVMKAEATFTLTKADKAFTKAIKGLSAGDPKIALAVKEWFSQYGLNVSSSQLLSDIIGSIGEKEDWTRFADTDGEDGLSIDQTRALRNLYWKTYTLAVRQGSIKAEAVPSIIWERFSTIRKNERKAEKKAQREAEKKAQAEAETKAA